MQIVAVLLLLVAEMAKSTTGLLMAPVENLKGFAMSRPPFIIFLVCLGLFSVILMTLAFIVKDNELKNPDMSRVGIFITLFHFGVKLMNFF